MTTTVAIKAIAERILTADGDSATGKVDYLRQLVGDFQEALGSTARQRGSKAARLTPEERTHHLTTLVSVNERFYSVVQEAAREKLPPGPDKGKRLNASINWARTALRDIRGYVRAGHDIRAVGAGKLTLRQLRIKVLPRPASAAMLRRRMVEQGKDLIAAVLAVVDADPVAARTEVELVMSQLATQLMGLSGKPTRNAQEAATQHKPFRVKSTLFVPTETTIIRQQANPS